MTLRTWIRHVTAKLLPPPWSFVHTSRPGLEALEDRLAPATVTVNTGSAANDGAGGMMPGAVISLRWAIDQVNLGNFDQINFAIGTLGTVATIALDPNKGLLSDIRKPVTIDGYSQNNGFSTPTRWVNLDGTAFTVAGDVGPGLRSNSGMVTIRGLAIYGFNGDGIQLAASAMMGMGDTVVGCNIGLDANGDAATPNAGDGIIVTGNDNIIGSPWGNDSNLISNNSGNGVQLFGNGAVRNRISSNIIGMISGAGEPNDLNGIILRGGADNNTISANKIQGNSQDGILIQNSNDTQIFGNTIGGLTSGDGLGNDGAGVHITGTSMNNTIGLGAAGNIISGNAGDGVFLDGPGVAWNKVAGNSIGVEFY